MVAMDTVYRFLANCVEHKAFIYPRGEAVFDGLIVIPE